MAGEEALAQATERPSSPAAGSRSEERAQAVGGRVQRLVVSLVGHSQLIPFARVESRFRSHHGAGVTVISRADKGFPEPESVPTTTRDAPAVKSSIANLLS